MGKFGPIFLQGFTEIGGSGDECAAKLVALKVEPNLDSFCLANLEIDLHGTHLGFLHFLHFEAHIFKNTGGFLCAFQVHMGTERDWGESGLKSFGIGVLECLFLR